MMQNPYDQEELTSATTQATLRARLPGESDAEYLRCELSDLVTSTVCLGLELVGAG